MDLNELQSAQSRERQTDSLQQLRESFYADAGEFIQSLRGERDRVAEQADDPFDAPEVNRLTDDINTAEQTVEALYERRVGKIVKMASLAAADMPTEDEGLTAEEQALFETLVTAIEDNRGHVLDVLAGEASSPVSSPGPESSSASPSPSPADSETVETEKTDAGDSSTAVDAADLMGSGAEEDSQTEPGGDETPPAPPMDDEPPTEASSDPKPPEPGTAEKEVSSDGGPASSAGSDAESTVDRTRVRITDEVGPIYGVDDREYDLSTDDIVTLPADNATPLVERGAAEKLE
ncbi:hypothetical protein VB773_15820 [Haloarculaceae archaeon H-GB2-1]|nr:hypothetical protein [Haloarculaceae archaeon H-GB1-1]MEA5387415.1 hypothetical protein [Haloarculaceae archaeon H-GB11]MEA5408888.1 hypothetical protein [Haloarculaceae archaeon H-GB2-1]